MRKLLYYALLATTLITSCNAAKNASFDLVKKAISILAQAFNDNKTKKELEIFEAINQELQNDLYTQYHFKKETDNSVSLILAPSDSSVINATHLRNYNLTADQLSALETILTNLSAAQRRSERTRSGKRPAMQTTETQTDEPTQTTAQQQESPTNQVTSEPSRRSSRNNDDEDDDDDRYKRRRVPYIPATEIEKDKESEKSNENSIRSGAKPGMNKMGQQPGMQKPGMNQMQRSPYGPQPSYYRPMPRNSFGGPRESLQPRAVGGQSGNKTAHIKTQPVKKLKDATQEERNAIIAQGTSRVAQQESGTPEPEYSMPRRITASPQTVDHERRTTRKSSLVPRYNPSKDASLGMSDTKSDTQKTQSWSISNWFTNLWNTITSWFGANNNE